MSNKKKMMIPLRMLLFWCFGVFAPQATAVTTIMEQLDQSQLSNSLGIPTITGPFSIEVKVQFFDLATSWQRMFDFSTSSSSNHIFLTKYDNAGHVAFQYYDDNDNSYWLSVDNQVTVGTTDTWRVGVDSSGIMTLHKNGTLLKTKSGVPPPSGNLLRTQKLLGMSNPQGSNGLDGIVLGLKVQNLLDAQPPLYRSLSNFPSQVRRGSFTASAYVRFEETSSRSSQCVFHFAAAAANNSISFGQSSSGSGVSLQVFQNNVLTTCVATNAIIEGELALWKIQMLSNTEWSIEKNGIVLQTCSSNLVAPVSVFRSQMMFGECPYHDLLHGVVLGFRLDDGVPII